MLSLRHLIKRWKSEQIKKILIKRYGSYIESFKAKLANEEPIQDSVEDSNFPVWVCWWQKEENMPPIVKVCYKSLLKNANGHPVHLITLDNYTDYVTFPDYVMEKAKRGTITLTHLSDLLRFSLIHQYGGLWVDSTILVVKPIPEQFYSDIFSIKNEAPGYHVSNYYWTSFLFYGKKGNVFFDFVKNFFFEYWKEEDKLIHYLLVDYTIAIAYDTVPEIARLIDEIPYNNPQRSNLSKLFRTTAEYDPKVFEQTTSDTQFFKLTWKKDYKEQTANGDMSFYGFILNGLNDANKIA